MNVRRYVTLTDAKARRAVGFVGLVIVAALIGLAVFGDGGQRAVNVITFLFLTWLFLEQGRPCSCEQREDEGEDEEELEEADTDVFARIYDKEFFGYKFNFVEREEQDLEETTGGS